MSLLTLDAITLRSQDYSETSRIVSFFSREKGLVKGIAKGARGRKGRFASTLEPLQRVRVTLSVKGTRDLQTVTQADLLHPFAGVREDLFRSAYAQAAAELLGRLSWHEDPGEEIYDLLLGVLGAYHEGIGDPQLVFLSFEIHLAGTLGYALHFDRCAGCGGPLKDGGRFSYPQGAAWCTSCSPDAGYSVPIAAEVLELGRRLADPTGIVASAALTPSRRTRQELARLLRRHLEYHTETSLALRSLALAESLGEYAGKPTGGEETTSSVDVKATGD
ncbi:DNA repair protein RecO [Gemmatimonadota bacterium]